VEHIVISCGNTNTDIQIKDSDRLLFIVAGISGFNLFI